jgi:hypothetical protein
MQPREDGNRGLLPTAGATAPGDQPCRGNKEELLAPARRRRQCATVERPCVEDFFCLLELSSGTPPNLTGEFTRYHVPRSA